MDDGLLERYCAAFETHDVETLVSLIHEDATASMPPFVWSLRGREDIRQTLLGPDAFCAGSRAVPAFANGSPALGQYLPEHGGGHRAFALVILATKSGRVADITTYLDPKRLFPISDLPLALP